MEAARVEGNHERMRVLSEEGLKLSAEVGDKTNVAYCLEGLAAFAASEGRVVRAARLWGTAEALLEKIEATVYHYASDRSHYQREVDAARSQREATAWEAAWSEGRAMTLEEAIESTPSLMRSSRTPHRRKIRPVSPTVNSRSCASSHRALQTLK